MGALGSLFDIFAILYIFRSIQLGLTIWRTWSTVSKAPLTLHKKQLAEQASFFIAVPISVLIHEFCHALAVWLFGGEVVEFGYRVFWGYVRYVDNFEVGERWFIALAGTLGSLAFGLGIWLLLRHNNASALRYFGLRAFRFQVYFSLIYYPLFTLFVPVGDWRTIYDFQATPILSGATAVFHITFLGLFYYGDRVGWFDAAAHETIAAEEKFQTLAVAAAAQPDNIQLQLEYIDGLRRGGAKRKAQHQLEQFMQQQPRSSAAHLQMAALLSDGKHEVPKKAFTKAEEALNLGLPEPAQRAFAHQLMGRYFLDTGKGAQAVTHFSDAITLVLSKAEAAVSIPNQNPDTLTPQQANQLAQLHYLRNQAYRRQQKFNTAYDDIQQAVRYAQIAGNQQAQVRYQEEIKVLENHAGQRFNYQSTKTPNE